MNIKAILFDLYGTLIARQERHFLKQISAYHLRQVQKGKAIAQLGARVLDIKQKIMRTDLSTRSLPPELLSLFLLNPDEQIDDLEREFRHALCAESHATTIFPGTRHILSFFQQRGYALGVVSNVSTYHKEPFFRFGLDRLVDAAVFSCDVGSAKPEPEMYLTACHQLGVHPEEVVFVGDSYNMDVKTPLSLGMKAIHISPSARHPNHIRDISEMGLLLLTNTISHIQDHIHRMQPIMEHNIVLHTFNLHHAYDDRDSLVYTCHGSQNGKPCRFSLKRDRRSSFSDSCSTNTTEPSGAQHLAEYFTISDETFLLTSCANPTGDIHYD